MTWSSKLIWNKSLFKCFLCSPKQKTKWNRRRRTRFGWVMTGNERTCKHINLQSSVRVKYSRGQLPYGQVSNIIYFGNNCLEPTYLSYINYQCILQWSYSLKNRNKFSSLAELSYITRQWLADGHVLFHYNWLWDLFTSRLTLTSWKELTRAPSHLNLALCYWR